MHTFIEPFLVHSGAGISICIQKGHILHDSQSYRIVLDLHLLNNNQNNNNRVLFSTTKS